jgi:hypothetical protein
VIVYSVMVTTLTMVLAAKEATLPLWLTVVLAAAAVLGPIAGLLFGKYLDRGAEERRWKRDQDADLERWIRVQEAERDQWLRDQRANAYRDAVAEGFLTAQQDRFDSVRMFSAIASVQVFGSRRASDLAYLLFAAADDGSVSTDPDQSNPDSPRKSFSEVLMDFVDLTRAELRHSD